MKKVTILLLTIICIHHSFAQDNCARTTSFGSANLCLASVNGYQECYTEPTIKRLADGTEVPANMVLGFYLNNSTYDKMDSIGLIGFDDYFKVYGTKEIMNFDADKSSLDEMEQGLGGNFISKNWEEIEKDVNEVGLNIQVGVPTVIDSYNYDNKTFTYVLLTKYQVESGDSYTMAMTMNGMLVNQRLVWMAYYLNYQDESTIAKLKTNSNEILRRMIASN